MASWPAYGTIQHGAALAELGQVTRGISLMQEGIAGIRAEDIEMTQPMFLTMLATAYFEQGETGRGLEAVDEALERVEATGERHWEAETRRMRGELLLQRYGHQSEREADMDVAQQSFKEALEIARTQEARMLELRTSMSLSRLWLRRHQARAAYELLTPIYDWFSEGFSTKDLRAADALLVQLQKQE
jgi:predicted ATPase